MQIAKTRLGCRPGINGIVNINIVHMPSQQERQIIVTTVLIRKINGGPQDWNTTWGVYPGVHNSAHRIQGDIGDIVTTVKFPLLNKHCSHSIKHLPYVI